MKEKDDVRFRVEVAAKVLERAASKTSDIKLREKLLEFARRLRSLSSSELIEYERGKTINEIANEIREFIWRDLKPRYEVSNYEREPLLKPIELLEARIDEIIKSFEKKLEKIDEILKVIP